MSKSNKIILVFGIISITLLGIFMGYLQKQPFVNDFLRISTELEKEGIIKGTSFGVFAEMKDRKRGVRITYVPPAGVFGDEKKRKRDAKKLAGNVYDKIEKLNSDIREHNRRMVKEKRADLKPRTELGVWYYVVIMKSGGSGGCNQVQEHSYRFDSLEFQMKDFKRGKTRR